MVDRIGMEVRTHQISWPGDFRQMEAVIHEGRTARVIPLPPEWALRQPGMVPFMYDEEEGCFNWALPDQLRYVNPELHAANRARR